MRHKFFDNGNVPERCFLRQPRDCRLPRAMPKHDNTHFHWSLVQGELNFKLVAMQAQCGQFSSNWRCICNMANLFALRFGMTHRDTDTDRDTNTNTETNTDTNTDTDKDSDTAHCHGRQSKQRHRHRCKHRHRHRHGH